MPAAPLHNKGKVSSLFAQLGNCVHCNFDVEYFFNQPLFGFCVSHAVPGSFALGPTGVPFSLLPLSTLALQWLETSRIPEELSSRAEPGAMPPAFVAARALKLEAESGPQPVPTSYLIVRDEDSSIVGACGFKTQLGAWRVEVGYGVAPSAQGHGAATTALKLLTEIAFVSGTVEVLAEIIPDNIASLRVVQKLGFQQVGERLDEDNEYVTQWVLRS
jgi:ribosomal-protein-alanine N-acetyltransferase